MPITVSVSKVVGGTSRVSSARPTGQVEAPGVMEEFDIACRLGKIPVPFGASGWAARSIWNRVSEQPNKYYDAKNVAAALRVLGEKGKSDDEYIGAMFQTFEQMSSLI
jgi:hypothetical protein